MSNSEYNLYDTEWSKDDDLSQGDILLPDDDIQSVFRDVHPHFLDEKYTAFLVLSQTCDMVRRGKTKKCKSRYINLAVVRPLRQNIYALLDRVCSNVKAGEKVISGVYVDRTRGIADQLLNRVLNQNEQALGVLYLQPNADVGIVEHCIALLQVSIAVRSEEHYETLVNARRGRLQHEFQCKLGWLVGNLFSRVATQDMPTELVEDLKTRILGSHNGRVKSEFGVEWIPEKAARKAEKNEYQGIVEPRDSVLQWIREFSPTPMIDVALDRISTISKEVLGSCPQADIDTIKKKLSQDKQFQACIRP